MIFSYDGWGCCRFAEFCQNGPLAPNLKACYGTNRYNCWCGDSLSRPFLRMQIKAHIIGMTTLDACLVVGVEGHPIALRCIDFFQCPAGLVFPMADLLDMQSEVNDSRLGQCHDDDFADEVVAQAVLFCSLELIVLLGSGFHARWKFLCRGQIDRLSHGRKPIRPRSNVLHRVSRRQVKAIVLIFLCLDFAGVNAKIHAETRAMSSFIQPTRQDSSTANFETDNDEVTFMERPDAGDPVSLLPESRIVDHGFRADLAAVHGAIVVGREAEAGDLLKAFLTESAVRLPEVDPLPSDTYFASNRQTINKTPRRIRFYQVLDWQNALLAAWLPSGERSFITVFIAHMPRLSDQECPELLIILREDDLIHARPLLVDFLAHVTVRCGVWVDRDARVQDIFSNTEFDPFAINTVN